jgi:hypothetical protein
LSANEKLHLEKQKLFDKYANLKEELYTLNSSALAIT